MDSDWSDAEDKSELLKAFARSPATHLASRFGRAIMVRTSDKVDKKAMQLAEQMIGASFCRASVSRECRSL